MENANPVDYVRRLTETRIYPASVLLDVLLEIAAGKQTGSLIINFAGGKPDGTAEWRQRYDPQLHLQKGE